MERVVLVEHAGNRAFIYRTPCGILTYDKNRKRHDWRLSVPGVEFVGDEQALRPCAVELSFGENYGAACDAARTVPGSHIVLRLDGQPLRRTA